MSIATPLENMIEEIRSALESNEISECLEVDYHVWPSRVFYGITDHMQGKNRGAFPFVAFEIEQDEFAEKAEDGGTETQNIKIRFNIGKGLFNNNKEKAHVQMDKAIRKTLYKLRDTRILRTSEDMITFSAVVSAPWGYFQEVTLSADLIYNKTEFGDFE